MAEVASPLDCPFCDLSGVSETELNLHVNAVHLEQHTVRFDDNVTVHLPEDYAPERASTSLQNDASPHSSPASKRVKRTEGVGGSNRCLRNRKRSSSEEITNRRIENNECVVCNLLIYDEQAMTDHLEAHFAQNAADGARASIESVDYQDFDSESNDNGPECGASSIFVDTSMVDSGSTRTKQVLVPILNLYLQPNTGKEVWFANAVDHFASGSDDKGWSCGYRNLQMLLSSLVRREEYRDAIFHGSDEIPSIYKLQNMLESAWRLGFDKAGMIQMGGAVVGTTKWIGATEIATILSSLRIKCRLYDCHAPSGANGTHPLLFTWLRDHFQAHSSSSFELTERLCPPVYFQHQGHSRTVVGVEQNGDSISLIILDPNLSWHQMRTYKRTMNGIRAMQYQIVVVDGGVHDDASLERSKTLQSDRIS